MSHELTPGSDPVVIAAPAGAEDVMDAGRARARRPAGAPCVAPAAEVAALTLRDYPDLGEAPTWAARPL